MLSNSNIIKLIHCMAVCLLSCWYAPNCFIGDMFDDDWGG